MKNRKFNIKIKNVLAAFFAVSVLATLGSVSFAEDDGLPPEVWASRAERRAQAEAEEAADHLEEEDLLWEDDLLLYEDEEDAVLVGEELTGPVIIEAEILTGDEVTIGSILRFTSRITEEMDWETVTYQWQTSADGEEWFDVEDADQATLTITVDETNVDSYWRLVVRD